MTSQLRIYQIVDGRLDVFVSAWRGGVLPLRPSHGFTANAAWTIPGEEAFVWILSHTGPGTFEEADRAYYASPGRQALVPDPAELIEESRTSFIQALPLDP